MSVYYANCGGTPVIVVDHFRSTAKTTLAVIILPNGEVMTAPIAALHGATLTPPHERPVHPYSSRRTRPPADPALRDRG